MADIRAGRARFLQDLINSASDFWSETLVGPLLYLAFGAGLGVLWGDVLWSLRPFAPRRVSPLGVLISLAAALAGVSFLSLRIAEGTEILEMAGTGLGGALGLALITAAIRTEEDAPSGLASPHLLMDSDLQRGKGSKDRWILIFGAPQTGKSTLIDSMLRAAESDSVGRQRWHATRAPRVTHGGSALVSEVDLRSANGEERTLRMVESSRMDQVPGGRGLGEMDVIVVVFDPTQLAGIAETFPQGIRPPNAISEDGDMVILQMATMIARSEPDDPPTVWAMVSKADLLRFSVAPELLKFPVKIGPSWHDQMARLMVPDRRRLSSVIGLNQLAQGHSAFEWGGGSPLLSYERHGLRPGQAFGGAEMLAAILDSVA